MDQLNSPNLLSPLLNDEKALEQEFRSRKNEYNTKVVVASSVEELKNEGWLFDRKQSKRIRLKKIKPFDERLENKFWCLLQKLGFEEMNEGRSFKITFDRPAGGTGTKQIDVFAKDDSAVIVAECKASEKIQKRSLQKDIEEFANLQKPIANSIRKFYGNGFKPKILWLFVTENIVWRYTDIERANGENIKRITEREYRYFNQIADHLKHSGRYQFLAEFFANQKIPELEGRKIPAIRGKLGGRTMYTFVSTPRQLLRISFVNHRSLKDPEGVPAYQRLVQKNRMKAIGKYIDNGGFFPNNILINFNNKVQFEATQKDEEAGVHFGTLYFPNKYKSAWVIDGQHRLYGFSAADSTKLDQNVIVTAFEQMPHEEEAKLFVTINHEQKSVQRTLLDDLKGELEWGSQIPTKRIGAISSRLIDTLNEDLGGPLYSRVTAQGIKTTKTTCLTLPSLMDGLRHSALVGKATMKKKAYDRGPLCDVDDEKTLQRARAGLNQYFTIIREANIERWDDGPQRCLCTNAGIQAFMRLLGSLIEHYQNETGNDPKELEVDQLLLDIQLYLEPVLKFIEEATEEDFLSQFRVIYGTGGPREYYFKLCRLVRQNDLSFKPEGYLDWEEGQSEENITKADKQIQEINTLVVEYVFDKFKNLYGEEDNAYWEKGVSDKDMKSSAYRKSLEYPSEERGGLENYLEFLDIRKIVEKKENWPKFKSGLNLPQEEEKGNAKNLNWMDKINELRRIQAHKTNDRNYKPEDFEFINWVHTELSLKIKLDREQEND